jgi:hypothetical protein
LLNMLAMNLISNRGITNECKIMQVKTQQLYYVVEIRWMTTCFGLNTYFNWAIMRSNLSN